MKQLYRKIVSQYEELERISSCYGMFAYTEYQHNSIKRLARWCRQAGDHVYWDKLEFTFDLINEALDYVWYVYCT